MSLALGALALLPAMHLRCRPVVPPPPVIVQTPVEQIGGIEQAVVDLTNQHRASVGLAPVIVDFRLTNAAQSHANDLAATQTLRHDSSYGYNPGQRIAAQGYVARTWAENAAYGYPDAPGVMAGWIASPGHDANLLNASVVNIGVAAARGTNGVIYWVMDLAA